MGPQKLAFFALWRETDRPRGAIALASATVVALLAAGCGAWPDPSRPSPAFQAETAARRGGVDQRRACDRNNQRRRRRSRCRLSHPRGQQLARLVQWQVAGVPGGDTTVGTISASGQYTPPAVMPSPATIQIPAVSNTDSAESGSASVTLTAAPAVAVAVSPTAATLLAGSGSQTFVATVSNTSNTTVTWAVNGVVGGNAAVGTISASGDYNAPAAPPAQPTVTITATSAADPTQSAVASDGSDHERAASGLRDRRAVRCERPGGFRLAGVQRNGPERHDECRDVAGERHRRR